MKSHRILLYLSFLIPIFMLLIIIYTVRTNQITLHPQSNFIYALYKYSDGFSCSYKLKFYLFPNVYPDSYEKSKPIEQNCWNVKIFLYDFDKKVSTPLTIDEAKSYADVIYAQSKEGYSIQSYCNTGTSFGWWGNMNSYVSCLTKGSIKNLLELKPLVDPHSPYNEFIFLGWVPKK